MSALQPGFYWVTFQTLRLPAALAIEHSPLKSKPELLWILPGMCTHVDSDQITNAVPCIEPERELTDEEMNVNRCMTCGKMKLGEDTPATFRCTC